MFRMIPKWTNEAGMRAYRSASILALSDLSALYPVPQGSCPADSSAAVSFTLREALSRTAAVWAELSEAVLHILS